MAAIVSPQLQAVGEPNPNRSDLPNNKNQQTYISQLLTNNSASNSTKLVLKPVQIIHGEPTIQFTMEERQSFAVEEGLHQAVVLKLSPRAPDLQVLRSLLPKILSIKGHCLIGHLASRQLLLRLDQPEDFVIALARTVNYFSHSGEQHQYRVFPWTVGYNPKEETSKAAVWISLPNLSPELFARQSLLSIATAVGKPIAIDKATQVKSRPSTARVKVILDLLDKLPTRIRLQHVDNASGKIVEVFQEVIYDNLPGYCINCKRQGHVEDMCRLLLKNKIDDVEIYNDDISSVDKLKGDARDFLNSKRASQLLEDVAKEVGKCNVTETANGEFNKADASQLKSTEGISDANRIAGVEQDPLAIEKHAAAVNGTLETVGTLDSNAAGQHFVTRNDADRVNANGAVNANTIAAGQHGDKGEDTNNNIEVWNMVPARKSPNSKQLPSTKKNAGQDAFKLMSNSNYFEALQGMEDGVSVAANAIDRDEQTMVKQVGHLEEGPTKKKVITLDAQNNGIHDELSRVIEKPAGINTLKVGNIDLVKDVGQWGRPLEIIGKDAAHVGNFGRHIEQKNGDDKESNVKIIEGPCTNEVVGQKTISESTNAGNGKKHVTDKGVGPKGSVFVADSTKNNIHGSLEIKNGQMAMILNSSLEKQPFVTLNTSVFQIPSQSGELYGESEGAVGQLTLSTGNNDEFIQAKVINSKLWLQQCDEDGEEDNDIINSNVRETTTKSNVWIQQREYDDEENLGVNFVDDSSDYGEKCSGDEEMPHVLSPIPKEDSHALIKANSMLNATAPDFIPSSRQLMHGPSTSSSIKIAKNSHGSQQHILEEQIKKAQNKAVVATTNVESACVATDNFQDAPQLVNTGREIFAQGEEDELLQECRAKASRKGDISPMHSGKGKNNHTRKISWDGKASELLNVRRPPMRNAKQKQVVPTTSTRSNRSKKN